MVLPLIIGGALGAIGGSIAQGVAGSEAANKQAAAAAEAADRIAAVRNPQFDIREYSPEMFNPTMYGPQQEYGYQQISDSPEARAYAMQALQRMAAGIDSSVGSQNDLANYEATSAASRLAKGREQAIAQQMARRGAMTPGMEMVMRQQASQDAADNARADAMRNAAATALQRLAGNQAMFGAASNLRGQDIDLATRNTDIINRFNAMNTDMRNWRNNANTGLMNDAGKSNTDERNRSQVYNIGRRDANARSIFDADMARAGGMNNATMARGAAEAQGINAIGSAIGGGLSSLGQLGGAAAASGAFAKSPAPMAAPPAGANPYQLHSRWLGR